MGKFRSFFRGYHLLVLVLVIFLELLPPITSLLCYTCLRLDCPESKTGLCNDVREFITGELRSWYYVDVELPKCPDPSDELSWKIMQIGTSPCAAFRAEYATCSLSRLQIIAELDDDDHRTMYATVMGCAHLNLLNAIKRNVETNSLKCAIISNNVTSKKTAIKFNYEIETCHVQTEYCSSKDFCIAPIQSIVRPFKPQTKDKSFDTGVIIGIIALAVVIVVALMLASMCRTPMSWASNTYRVSDQQVNIVSGECGT